MLPVHCMNTIILKGMLNAGPLIEHGLNSIAYSYSFINHDLTAAFVKYMKLGWP